MMNAHRTDRIWLLGGVIAIIALTAAGWFLLIHPRYTAAAATRSDAGKLQQQLATHNGQVAKRNAQLKQKKAIDAKLAAYENALPSTIKQNTFLRELQAAGVADHVDISGLSAGLPSQSTIDASVWDLPITMTAQGTATNLSKFLDRLQTGQTRAVLITSVGLTQSAGTTYSATLALTAFVAPTSTAALTTTD
jgi:type IV pilus assembly protein PilO